MKLNQYLAENIHLFDHNNQIKGDTLKTIVPDLLKLDEFKNVVEINVFGFPNYLADLNEKPLDPVKAPFLGEDEKQTIQSILVKLGPSINLNSVINLGYLELSPVIYDKELWDNIGLGVWTSPPIFNPKDMIPIKELKVRFSVEHQQDFNNPDPDFESKIKKELLDQIDKALSNKPNMPNKRSIMLRVSPNSINTKEEKDYYVYNVNLPVKQL